MGSRPLIRRPSKRFAFTALTHFFSEKPFPLSSNAPFSRTYAAGPAVPRPPSAFGLTRSFHSGLTMRAGFAALADYSDAEEKRSSPSDEGLEISKLGISEEIVSALGGRGIQNLFPIQRAVMEPAMQGRDMIGRARTRTGKTLAFGIPIIDKIIKFNAKHGQDRNPLALILAPTRELAGQVDKEFAVTATKLDRLCAYGGVPISRQISTLDRGVDVLVGTPGRVVDLIKRGSLNLTEVQFVVLDEADQMLNVGFADDVETILGYITQKHQTLMFSATMPGWILKIAQKFLRNPLTIDLVGNSDQKLADGISLYCIASDSREKLAIIGPLITDHAKGGKCIVFTQTKRDADRLAYAMQIRRGLHKLSHHAPSDTLKRKIAELEKKRKTRNPSKNKLFVDVPESKKFLDTATMPMLLIVVGTALFAKLLMMYDDSTEQERIERKVKKTPGLGNVRMLTREEWDGIQELRPRTPFESKISRPNAKIRTGEPLHLEDVKDWSLDVLTDALTRAEETAKRGCN